MQLEFEELSNCPACVENQIIFAFKKTDEYFKHEFNIFYCLNCGLYFVNPRIHRKHLLELYDFSYFKGQNWDDKTDYFSNYSNHKRLETLERLYCSHFENIQCFLGRENLNILDVGCGLGFFSQFISQKYPKNKITSVDISPDAVEYMKKKGFDAICGDIFISSLRQEYYDVVYMRQVMEHLYEPISYVSKVRELLKKGGLFFYTTGNTKEVDDIQKWYYIRPSGHIIYFNPRSIRTLFKKSGLRCYPRELLEKFPKGLIKYFLVKLNLRNELVPVGNKPP